jgi:hypothetical protein
VSGYDGAVWKFGCRKCGALWQLVEAGEDSVEEWYCRVNRHYLLKRSVEAEEEKQEEEEEEGAMTQGSADMDLSE